MTKESFYPPAIKLFPVPALENSGGKLTYSIVVKSDGFKKVNLH